MAAASFFARASLLTIPPDALMIAIRPDAVLMSMPSVTAETYEQIKRGTTIRI